MLLLWLIFMTDFVSVLLELEAPRVTPLLVWPLPAYFVQPCTPGMIKWTHYTLQSNQNHGWTIVKVKIYWKIVRKKGKGRPKENVQKGARYTPLYPTLSKCIFALNFSSPTLSFFIIRWHPANMSSFISEEQLLASLWRKLREMS